MNPKVLKLARKILIRASKLLSKNGRMVGQYQNLVTGEICPLRAIELATEQLVSKGRIFVDFSDDTTKVLAWNDGIKNKERPSDREVFSVFDLAIACVGVHNGET